MFKPSKPVGRATGIAALALSVPLCVSAGVTTSPEPQTQPAPAERTAKDGGPYQVRCWQHGRLLFEENHVSLPADNPLYSVRMTGTDRRGRPIFVAEAKTALCLIRHTDDPRSWPATPR